MEIYLAMADYEYEGEQVVRAFADKLKCEAFVAECNAYKAAYPGRSATWAERAAWLEGGPTRHNAASGFNVAECEFDPSASSNPPA